MSVLLIGESGTGKELLARLIHQWSLIVLPCRLWTSTLAPCQILWMESELFGHEKGAFTGATQQRKGMLEMADGGNGFPR